MFGDLSVAVGALCVIIMYHWQVELWLIAHLLCKLFVTLEQIFLPYLLLLALTSV